MKCSGGGFDYSHNVRNAWIKNVLVLRKFSLRRLDKIKAQCKLVCLGPNLGRMCSFRVT